MEDRAAFTGPPEADGAKVVAANTATGALYERFELVLPKGWEVERSTDGQIEILTRRFTLTVRTDCSGGQTALPRDYLTNYLQLEEAQRATRHMSLLVDVSVHVAPRRAWLMTAKGWQYYRWIDEWMSELTPALSKEAYLDRIGFYTAQTTLRLVRSLRKKAPSTTTESAQSTSEPLGHPAIGGREGSFQTGDAVEHASFGLGQVIAVEPGGIVVVEFDSDHSKRKLMADYAPLRHIRTG
jgi:hypothetical protein